MAPGPEDVRPEPDASRIIPDALADVMAHASHDLVGPFNRAASLTDLLIRRHKDQLGAEGERVLEFLSTCSARMEEVAAALSRYLQVASAPRGFSPVDLNECVAGAKELLAETIAGSRARIESDFLPTVSANRFQITKMFELLIENSIRFRQPDVIPHVRISAVRSDNVEDIAVTDNGIGIDPEFEEVVFQPFRRLHGTKFPGAGLGLTTAKLIADLHGSRLRVVQTGRSGVSFHFNLTASE